MRVRFWGTRGSLPKPGPSTLRYGGNTSCVEIHSAAGTHVILDCGTGAHGLGRALLGSKRPLRGHILISHTHWDHIQGLPFFAPFFVPGNEWDLYGPHGLSQTLRDVLAGQMQYSYFPISLEHFAAEVRYHDLIEGAFTIGDIAVRTRYLNHPALTLGYRLEADGVCVVYACDHEPHSRRLATGIGELVGQDRRHAEFLAGADLVIHDAQYTVGEYAEKIGWGHSTPDYAMRVCRAAGARRLAMTHHEPLRDDDALDRVVADARAAAGGEGEPSPLEVFAAAEGQVVDLGPAVAAAPPRAADESSAVSPGSPALLERSILLGAADPATVSALLEAVRADNVRLIHAGDGASALRLFDAERPSLVILERDLPGIDALEVSRAIRRAGDAAADEVPVIVVAAQDDNAAGADAGVTDWLVEPFSSVYARARVRAWLMRTRCRWLRPPLPDDEEQRVAALQRLGILDSGPEERFDRLTRLAAALFDVPFVLVTLIDRDRQAFKSCHGSIARETSREVSFCAHAILRDEVMVVPDALRDARFADNPVVLNEPRIRFYAGFPLALPCGSRIGTLCLIDTRPRQLDEAGLGLLRDLGRLVQQELRATAGP